MKGISSMENLQQEEKDIACVVDVRKITAQPTYIHMTATKEQCQALAEHFEIIAVDDLNADVKLLKKEDIIELTGTLKAHVKQECVVTLEPMENEVVGEFDMLFSTTKQPIVNESVLDIDVTEEPIEFLPRPQIYFKDIIFEQFGLNLDYFPRKTDELFVYREDSEPIEKENPFAVLKHLTKE